MESEQMICLKCGHIGNKYDFYTGDGEEGFPECPEFPVFTKSPALQKGWWFFKQNILHIKLVFSMGRRLNYPPWRWIKTPDSRSGMKGFRRLAREGRI